MKKKLFILLLVVVLSITSLFSVTLTVWSSEKQQDFIRKIGQEFTETVVLQLKFNRLLWRY